VAEALVADQLRTLGSCAPRHRLAEGKVSIVPSGPVVPTLPDTLALHRPTIATGRVEKSEIIGFVTARERAVGAA
jgi:hypothetical protein